MSNEPSVAQRIELRFPPTLVGFGEAMDSLREFLDTRSLPPTPRLNVELAFEEMATNIVRHGAATAEITATITVGDDQAMMAFEDNGVPFDPREQAAPPAPDSLDDAQIGGLGIVLVRKISSRMEYERTASNHNRLLLAIPLR